MNFHKNIDPFSGMKWLKNSQRKEKAKSHKNALDAVPSIVVELQSTRE